VIEGPQSKSLPDFHCFEPLRQPEVQGSGVRPRIGISGRRLLGSVDECPEGPQGVLEERAAQIA